MRTRPALLAFALFVTTALADDPPRPSFTDSVRAAAAARKVDDSDNLHRATFRDVAEDGSVLVGVEVGLAKWFDSEIPYAVRPIFRRGEREWVGGTAGSFSSREVIRTQRETAQPGYAVAGLWVRTGAGMDRMCLHYVKITDAGLDPADNYASSWIGTSDGGSESYIGGNGRPIVGLSADAGRDQTRALGLVFAQVPPAQKKKEPKPKVAKVEPKKETPVVAADPGPPKKSRVEEEAPPKDDGSNMLLLVVVLGCLLLGVPIGIVALVSMSKSERLPPRDRDADERPRRPRPRPEGRRPEQARRPEPVAPEPATPARPELARRLAGYAPVQVAPRSAAVTGIDLSNGQPPPFFVVRATYRARHERITRVYVTPTELLAIDAGAGSDMNHTAGIAAAALSGGGLIGALIGGAVGSMVADAQKAKGAAYQHAIDRLDLSGLMALAEEKGNFRAPLSELVGVTIDPPSTSFWRERTNAVGIFRFRHLGQGEFTFEFLSGAEVRGAADLLRRVMGSAVHLGSGWDEATAVYMSGL